MSRHSCSRWSSSRISCANACMQRETVLWVQSAGGHESAARGLVRHLHDDADAGLQVVCSQGGDAEAEVDVPAVCGACLNINGVLAAVENARFARFCSDCHSAVGVWQTQRSRRRCCCSSWSDRCPAPTDGRTAARCAERAASNSSSWHWRRAVKFYFMRGGAHDAGTGHSRHNKRSYK